MKRNNKGFTLAELLIVVAIIGVLVAIAMPTFGKQLENAKKAADVANLRAAYSEAVAEYLTNSTNPFKKNIDFTHKKDTNWLSAYSAELPFTSSDLAGVEPKEGGTDVYFHFSQDTNNNTVVTANLSST